MTWVPANRYLREAGIEDGPDDALAYIRATAPEGWAATEDALRQAQARHGGEMLDFVLDHSPARFAIVDVPDPHMDLPGARERGRLPAPEPISARAPGDLGRRIRGSTIPQALTYAESVDAGLMRHPIRGMLKYARTHLLRWLTRTRAKGSGMIIALLKGRLDLGCRVEVEARVTELIVDPQDEAVAGVVAERRGGRQVFRARRGAILATGGFEWDAELLAAHFPGDAEFRSSPHANTGDGLKTAPTPDDPAARTGLPAEALKAAFARFNGFAAKARDEDFHRGESDHERRQAERLGRMAPSVEPPFAAFEFRPSILGAKGGRAHQCGRPGPAPRRRRHSPGLYCAGNVMANPTGMKTPSQAGATLGPCMSWGFVVAAALMRWNRRARRRRRRP